MPIVCHAVGIEGPEDTNVCEIRRTAGLTGIHQEVVIQRHAEMEYKEPAGPEPSQFSILACCTTEDGHFHEHTRDLRVGQQYILVLLRAMQNTICWEERI
jgi:hypothetical protein